VVSLVDAHRAAWQERWSRDDIRIDGDAAAQQALRFAAYHLISAANPHDERVSIGARALTGPGYRGHVFWDTEIYMLPFFILTDPPAARALLMYRYHTLPAARANAARHGQRGARFAWESADTGEEVTPRLVIAPDGEVVPIEVGEREQHITADVAYGVWCYWHTTGDDRFLCDAGAEILVETARFWASRAQAEHDGHYHIRGVIGPDEYHVAVDDDAFTNGMAQWNLETAATLIERFCAQWPEESRALSSRLHLAADEARSWREIASRFYTGFDPETGLIEQFQGYFRLEEIPLPPFTDRAAPMDVLLGRDRIARSKVIKQPDVLMLLYLLWDRFTPAVREANFRYYEPRTAHGSSLSPSIHALMAARLGDREMALRHFRQAAEIDLADNMGNASTGVHIASLGGLWQSVIFGFCGLSLSPHGPQLRPCLPATWSRIRFGAEWKGHRYRADVRGDSATWNREEPR
jgi:kojibiose phosphorylase